jgi:hypothetical protein
MCETVSRRVLAFIHCFRCMSYDVMIIDIDRHTPDIVLPFSPHLNGLFSILLFPWAHSSTIRK